MTGGADPTTSSSEHLHTFIVCHSLGYALQYTVVLLQKTSQGWIKPSAKEEEKVPAVMLHVALMVQGFIVAVDSMRERTASTL